MLTVRTEGESSTAQPAPFKPGAFEPRPGALEPRPGSPFGEPATTGIYPLSVYGALPFLVSWDPRFFVARDPDS